MHSETWTQSIPDRWPFNGHPAVDEPLGGVAAPFE